ncbi:MAG: hypothetical protein KA795_08085 [Burkholderiaceae bacterium]|nr:hypothetical protein [Burkholderiaceae bacterium]
MILLPSREPDYAAFLRDTLPRQAASMAPHVAYGRRVWLKKAGPRNPRWRYAVMGAIAGLARLEMLRPVMNLGGAAAIAHEARRLRELAALGLRVPTVLAESPHGLLIDDLGQGQPVGTLLGHVSQAALRNGDEALAQWQRGLDAIALVHARGSYLSQAFARNLVACPDGVIGYIDFEDDPGATIDLTHCQARDWLSYLHSTALYVQGDPDVRAAARARWQAVIAADGPAVAEAVAQAASRMGWLRHLPSGAHWGTDVRRLRAAVQFLRG